MDSKNILVKQSRGFHYTHRVPRPGGSSALAVLTQLRLEDSPSSNCGMATSVHETPALLTHGMHSINTYLLNACVNRGDSS